jgi:hypothetical protein
MKTLILFFLCAVVTLAQSQSSLFLQPDAAAGKDARIFNLDALANYGNDPDFIASQWTYSGEPGTMRSLIQFDLSGLPKGVDIVDARLSLYYNNESTTPGQAGNNAAYIRRLIEPWDEATVAWNHQPFYTTENEVLLPASTVPDQDYLNIDVTNLVRDMIEFPNTSHGFMFMLQTEQGMNAMKFYSSDASEAFERPSLQITWGVVGTSDINAREIIARPNPFVDGFAIENINGTYTINISDLTGQRVHQSKNESIQSRIEVTGIKDLLPGIYVVTATNENETYFSKIIKN